MTKDKLQQLVAQYNKENPIDKVKLVDVATKYYVLANNRQQTSPQQIYAGGLGFITTCNIQEYKVFYVFATLQDAELFIATKEYKEYGGYKAKLATAQEIAALGFDTDVEYYRYFDKQKNMWLFEKF